MRCGWTDIEVHQNHQCARKIPPYSDTGASQGLQVMRDCHASGAVVAVGGTWENVRRFYLAGGGDETRLPGLWDRMRKREAALLQAIEDGTYVSAGGHIHVMVWGHKPV